MSKYDQVAAPRQYYYKNNGCHAANPESEDCICWHDEGTGPMETSIWNVQGATWRTKPMNTEKNAGQVSQSSPPPPDFAALAQLPAYAPTGPGWYRLSNGGVEQLLYYYDATMQWRSSSGMWFDANGLGVNVSVKIIGPYQPTTCKECEELKARIERLRERVENQTLATQEAATTWHNRVLEQIDSYIPSEMNKHGHPIDQLVGMVVEVLRLERDEARQECERLRAELETMKAKPAEPQPLVTKEGVYRRRDGKIVKVVLLAVPMFYSQRKYQWFTTRTNEVSCSSYDDYGNSTGDEDTGPHDLVEYLAPLPPDNAKLLDVKPGEPLPIKFWYCCYRPAILKWELWEQGGEQVAEHGMLYAEYTPKPVEPAPEPWVPVPQTWVTYQRKKVWYVGNDIEGLPVIEKVGGLIGTYFDQLSPWTEPRVHRQIIESLGKRWEVSHREGETPVVKKAGE